MTAFKPNPNRSTAAIAILVAFFTTLFNPLSPAEAKSLRALGQFGATTTPETTPAGRPDAALLAEQDSQPEPDKVVKAVLTAYTSTPDQTDDTPCITADGTNVCTSKTPTVAANWLPFKTKVKIPALFGEQIFEVHDRMNKRYGYGRMDIWFDTTKAEARKFGVKRAEIEIYYVKPAPKEIAKR